MKNKKIILLLFDVVIIGLSFLGAYWIRFGGLGSFQYSRNLTAIYALSFLFSFYLFGAYEIGTVRKRNLVLRSILAVLMGGVFVLSFNYFFVNERSGIFGRGVFVGGSGLLLVGVSFIRIVFSNFVHRKLSRENLYFIGSSFEKSTLESDLKSQKFRGTIQYLDPRQDIDFKAINSRGNSVFVLGVKNLSQISGLANQLMQLKFLGYSILDLATFYELQWQKVPFFYIDEEWLLTSGGFSIVFSKFKLRVKRVFDLFASIALLLVSWPFMLLTILAIKLESKGPAIFKQTRTGLNGETFTIYKFRSMAPDAEKHGAQWAQKNDARVTRVGAFIRKARLDELPQLFNVLKGEMSFVGPRPERPEFNVQLEKEIPFYNFRHMVPPGLTGWAQVNYPYGASIEDAKEKLAYELYYIKNHSLFLDLYILLKTIRTVLLGKGL